jgi:hypothetical protein
MKKIHRAILAGAVLLSAIVPSGAFAQTPGSGEVRANVSLVLGDGLTRTIALGAATQRDGTAAGSIEFHDPSTLPSPDVDGTGDPALAHSSSGVMVTAQVTCLFVAGHAAVVGGDVVRADPERYVGKQIVVLLTDGGQGPGRMSWGFYEPEQRVSCDSFPFSAHAPVEITSGRTEVNP